MNHVAKKQQGFTIIEMILAMTFISFLLLSVAMTVIQFGSLYNKGTTLKDIDQASRDLNSELQRSVATAGALDLTTDFVYSPATVTDPAHADGGRLCLGSYSYIWNYAKALNANAAGVTGYESDPTTLVRFVKVPDPGKAYCAKSSPTEFIRTSIIASDKSKSVELLKSGDHDLGIHQFTIITPPTTAIDTVTREQVYSINYVIGTSNTTALTSDQSKCLDANLPGADPLYCDVQQFGLVVRSGT